MFYRYCIKVMKHDEVVRLTMIVTDQRDRWASVGLPIYKPVDGAVIPLE